MGFWGNDFKPQEYDVNSAAYVNRDAEANTRALAQAALTTQQRSAPQAQAASMGGAQLGAAAQSAGMAAPNALNVSDSDQVRAQQQAVIGQQQALAMGQGPSVAQQQLQMAQDQNMRSQMAQAASMRGGVNPALTQRQLADNAAMTGQQTGQASALLRAQESLGAQAQLGNMLGQARSQDIGLAQAQGQQGLAAAQLGQQNQQFNAGSMNQFSLQQGQMDQTQLQQNAAFQQQTALANQGAQAQQNQMADAMRQFQLNGQIGIDTTSLQASMAADQAKQQAFQAQQGLQAQVEQQNSGFGKALVGGLLQAGGSAASAALMSDVRLKTKINRSETGPQVRALLDALDSASYEYKDPADGGAGRKWGVMAQSLEKSDAGRSLVVSTPHGKGVDTTRGFGTLLAAIKDVHDRTKKLEGAR